MAVLVPSVADCHRADGFGTDVSILSVSRYAPARIVDGHESSLADDAVELRK